MEPVVDDDAGQGNRDVVAAHGGDVPLVGVADVAEDILVQVELPIGFGFGMRRLFRPEDGREQQQQGCEQKSENFYPMHTVTTLLPTSTKPPGQGTSRLSAPTT